MEHMQEVPCVVAFIGLRIFLFFSGMSIACHTTTLPSLPHARSSPPQPPPPLPLPFTPTMGPETMRRASVAFRLKLSRDTGVNLPAADCEALLGTTFSGVLLHDGRRLGLNGEDGEEVTLQSNPGRFCVYLGEAIADQTIGIVIPNRLQVACWCFREAAEAGAYARPLVSST